MLARRLSKNLVLFTILLCGMFSVFALADSQVRIVRLSDINGDVQIDHGSGFEKALRNMPITQGARLKTADGGLAEVEFENGSTVRLAPNTLVSFPELSLRDSGAKVSSVDVSEGIAYFNFNHGKGDEFQVRFANQRTILKKSARFRIDLGKSKAEVSVTKGDVHFQGPSGEIKVSKKHTLTFDPENAGQYELAKGVAPDQYDNWNDQASQYQTQYSYTNEANNAWPYRYGLTDLNYYGNYYSVPGYGLVWQPSMVGANWDPFMNGAWSWYPGLGYTWVSTDPWGWMPYRYGSWAFIPGYGWGWMPGGFNSWNRSPVVASAPVGFRRPTPPATSSGGHPTLIVSRGGLPSTPRRSDDRPAANILIHGQPAAMTRQGTIAGAPKRAEMNRGSAMRANQGRMGQSPRMQSAQRTQSATRTQSSPRMQSAPRMDSGPRSMGGFGSSVPRSSAPSATRSSSPH